MKSVDAITRQNSITTGESVDSTYGDYDYDNRSSSVNRDSSSMFYHSTPRNFSVSRSTSPKGSLSKQKSRVRKPKDRSGSPLAYERSSSPKILEGVSVYRISLKYRRSFINELSTKSCCYLAQDEVNKKSRYKTYRHFPQNPPYNGNKNFH